MRPPAAPTLAAFAVAIVLGAAFPAAAQQVYKWKDARGVTHYSEKPPASGSYSTQEAVKDPVASAPTGNSTAPTAADPRCTTARNNLARLQAAGPVRIENNGEGAPDQPLTDTERANQIELARSTLKAYNCSEGAAPAG